MALVLRTNGAPLSGALFVSNPRKNRRKRRNGLALTTSSQRRSAALRALRNRRNRRNSALKSRRNAIALKTNRGNRRNGLALRRNSYGAFQNKLTTPVADVVGKAPIVGEMAKKYVAPIVMGVLVGGVHYAVMYGLSKVPMAESAMGKVKPVQFTLTGIVAATALHYIPVGSQKLRDQIAVGALMAGSALDMYRLLSSKVGDLGDMDEDYDGLYEDGYIEAGGLYEDGYIEAGDLYEDGYVETGDGGAYDVVPLAGDTADLDYSGASESDAVAAPADFSVEEGEYALAGPWAWFQRFGPPPRSIHRPGGYSSMVHQQGHRFGWLIKLVGFPRFQKIVALAPEKRVTLLAQLREQAVQAVDAQSAGNSMGGVALDMSGLAIDMSGATLDMRGELSGLAYDVNGMGAVMAAGSAV